MLAGGCTILAGEVLIRLVADVSSMRRDLNQAKNSIDDISRSATQGHENLKRMFQFAGGFALLSFLEQGVSKLGAFIKESTMAAARVEEMDKVLSVLGKNAGYSSSQIDTQAKAIKGLGIQTSVAQESLSQFLKFNLDLTKAGELARVAQDVAVIGGQDSSQTLQSLLWGVTTRQPEIIRNAGLTVNFEQEFARLAAEQGKAVSALTEHEKIQASLNAVIREGVAVEGAYEKAMESALKQLRSRERYVDEFTETFGAMFTAAWSSQVFAVNDIIKMATTVFSEDGKISMAVRSGTRAMANTFDMWWTEVKAKFEDAERNGTFDRIGEAIENVTSTVSKNQSVLAALTTTGGLAGLGKMLGLIPGMPSIGLKGAGPIGMLVGMVTASKELRSALTDLAKSFGQVFGYIGESASPVMAALDQVFLLAGNTLADLVEAATPLIPTFGEAAAVALQLVAAGLQLVAAVSPIVTVFIELLAALLEIDGVGKALAITLATLLVAHKAMTVGTTLVQGLAKAWGAVTTAVNAAKAAVIAQNAATAAGALTSYGRPGSPVINMAGAGAARAAAGAGAGAGAAGLGAGIAGVAAAAGPILAVGAAIAAVGLAVKSYNDMLKQHEDNARGYGEMLRDTRFEGDSLKTISEMQKVINENKAVINEIESKGADNLTSQEKARWEEAHKLVSLTEEVLSASQSEWLPQIADAVGQRLEQAKQVNQEIGDQAEILAVSLKLPLDSYAEVANILPAQQKIIGDFLSQLVQDTKTWRDQLISIPEAASAATKALGEGGGKITASGVTEQLNKKVAQTSAFGTNLQAMQDLGAGTTILQQYLKKGPEAAGEGLAQIMADLRAMGDEEAKKVIADWNSSIESIGKSIDSTLQQLAVDLMNGDIKMDTEAAVQEMVQQLQTLRGTIEPTVNDINSIIGGELLGGETTNRIKESWAEIQAAVAAGDQSMVNMLVSSAKGYLAARDSAGAFNDSQKQQAMIMNDLLDLYGGTAVQFNYLNNEYAQFLGVSPRVQEQIEGLREKHTEQLAVVAALDRAYQGLNNNSWGGKIIKRWLDNARTEATDIEGQIEKLLNPDTIDNSVPRKVQELIDKDNQRLAQAASPAAQQPKKNIQQEKDAVDELKRAYDTVYGVIGDVQSSTHSLAQSKEEMSSTIGTAVLSHKSEAETMRAVEEQAASAAEAIKSQAFAMAESGQIGRDAGSINAYIAKGLDDLTASVEQNVNAWIAEKGELISVTALMEEIEKSWGRMATSMRAANATQKSGDSVISALYEGARMVKPSMRETESAHMAVEESVLSALDAIRAEAEAMAASGQIGKDWSSIVSYMSDKALDLRNEVTGLTSAWADQARQLEDVDTQLARVRKGYEEYLDVFVNEASASYNSRDAMRQLYGIYRDNTAALSGYNTNAEERDILNEQLRKGLNNVVASVRAEAEALAKAGKLGSDAASQHAFLTEKLKELQGQYPELSSLIEEYLGHIAQIPEDVTSEADFLKDMATSLIDQYLVKIESIPKDKDTNARVYVDAAMAVIRSYRQAIEAWIPRTWDTYMRVNVDQSSLNAAQAQLQGLSQTALTIQQATQQLLGPLAGRTTPLLPMGFVPGHADGAIMGPSGSLGLYRWAESASGGESLVPHSMSKRGRAEQIMDYTAMKFGGRYTKGDSPGYPMGDQTTIEHLEVVSTAPPREWLQEAAWLVKQESGL